MNKATTNTQKLEELNDRIHEIITTLELLRQSTAEIIVLVKGNSKPGLVERVNRVEGQVSQIDSRICDHLENHTKEKEKKQSQSDKWFWLIIDKIFVSIFTAVITAITLQLLLK